MDSQIDPMTIPMAPPRIRPAAAPGSARRLRGWGVALLLSLAAVACSPGTGAGGKGTTASTSSDAAAAAATPEPATAQLSGTVTAQSPFTAAQVYAWNRDRNMLYMVFTGGTTGPMEG